MARVSKILTGLHRTSRSSIDKTLDPYTMMSGRGRLSLNRCRAPFFFSYALFILFVCGSCTAPDQGSRGVQLIPKSEDTQVVILGTGTPNIDPQRFGACIAVIVNGKPYPS